MTFPSFTLVSHVICPFVQRAAIVLSEKEIPFERIMIDLTDKPEWFKRMSPLGKVPLLIVRAEDGAETILFESTVICEYLEEIGTRNQLHPSDPLAKARSRAWMEFGSAMLSDAWAMLNSADIDVARTKRNDFRDKLTRFEGELNAGGYFEGSRFSMVDVIVAPIFRYFDTIEPELAEPLFQGFEKVSAWRLALRARPSVASAVTAAFADTFRARLRAQNSIFQDHPTAITN